MADNLYDFDNNGLARAYKDCKWALFDRCGNQVGEWYSYIEEWGEGFYKIEQGAKKNIMRPDGTVVLKAWHNDVFKVKHGFFLFSNTIRKSKNNPKTRYTYGLAHVTGDVIFPMIFDSAEWLKKGDGIYAEINSKPYILTLDGSVYDPARDHLPQKMHDETAMNFVNETTGQETSLIDMARKSLDEKMQMEVHPRSLDKEFCARMEHPIGLDDDFYPVPINSADEPEEGPIANLSNMIHKLADDADIKDFINVEDNYPYHGVEGSVCEGCIYANGIQGHGEGCGRLFIKSFRERYLKGRCEYRKTELGKPSHFEEMDKYNQQKAKEKEEKTSEVYALRTIKTFTDKYLGGDISKLRDYDLSKVKEDETYGNVDAAKSAIVKSVLALVFADSWPGLSVESIERYEYCSSMMIHSQNLFGSNILDQYFKGMEKFCPSKELFDRALKVFHLLNSIGNMWVLPNKLNDKGSLASYKDAYKFRGYMDKYLQAMYAVFEGAKKQDLHLKGIFYKNRKMLANYQGITGWTNFVNNMLLQGFVDDECKPKDCFDFVWSYMKDIDRDSYFRAVDRFCTFCEKVIPQRADRMIEKLETILNNK